MWENNDYFKLVLKAIKIYITAILIISGIPTRGN